MNKKIIDWLKRNWILLLLIGILIYFLGPCDSGYFQYKSDIRAADDSIAKLELHIAFIENQLQVSHEMIDAAEFEKDVYLAHYNSLKDTNEKLILTLKGYESKIDNLKLVPTSAIYIDVTGWLDSLSVQWATSEDSW